tara:strand:+ start:9242 stop:10075 length:834 start_codon:yes stop_codon:yes gene_type:complete
MSQYAVETQDSRQVQVGDGKATISRTWKMWGFPNEQSAIRGFNASYPPGPGLSGSTFVPRIGSAHPHFTFMKVHRYNLTQMPGTNDAWVVQFEYRNIPVQTRSPPTPTGLPSGPDAISFEEITGTVSGSFIMAYRSNPSPPALGRFGEGEGDIGGVPCDAGGQPTSQMRYQYEITKSIVTEQNFESQLGQFGSFVGTRGSGFGLPDGSLLYRGASIQRIEANKYRVQHTYLYDSNSHCLQVPRYNKDGQFDLDEDGHVDMVYWKQPFPDANGTLPGI